MVIVRLHNTLSTNPSQSYELSKKLRSIVKKPLIVHVAPDWIELVVFSSDPETVRKALEKGGYKVAEAYYAPLVHGVHSDPLRVIAQRYLAMMRGQRFWEAHSVGEELWHRKGVKGRVLAAIAGAFAKAQEGSRGSAIAILEKARKWAAATGVNQLIDWECLYRSLDEVYSGGRSDPGRCLARLVEELV